MTYKILIALIFRIAGLLLFVNFFNHIESHFISIFTIDSMPFINEDVHGPFNKYYFTSLIIGVLNLIVSAVFVLKADQLSNKIIKQDRPLNIELTPKTLIRSVIILFGVLWMGKSIYLFPNVIEWIIALSLILLNDTNTHFPEFPIIVYILKIVMAYLFIFKSDKIINFLQKKNAFKED